MAYPLLKIEGRDQTLCALVCLPDGSFRALIAIDLRINS